MIKNYPIQPYHLVTYSPWPIGASIAGLIITLGGVLKMNLYGSKTMIIGIILLIVTVILWFKDISVEGSIMGYHTSYVSLSITIGVILFIVTEIMLFVSLFWAYFHTSLSPSIEIGTIWPPIGIEAINAYELPLTNTIMLITSGATITASQNYILSKKYKKTVIYLVITIVILIVFIAFQGIEYYYSSFTMTDSVYGSVFYMTTGLHGIHIIVGCIYLIVSLIRIMNYSITSNPKGYEYAILMTHLYNIFWLFIFITYYLWTN